jgi:hypothetical protein
MGVAPPKPELHIVGAKRVNVPAPRQEPAKFIRPYERWKMRQVVAVTSKQAASGS